jgi:hypothetical protein
LSCTFKVAVAPLRQASFYGLKLYLHFNADF